MKCWYCYWGWAERVADICDEAVEHLGDSEVFFGPGHIVFSDENFDDNTIRFCIGECEAEHEEMKAYLERLLQIPEAERCCQPADYDGENPERFPPTSRVRKPGHKEGGQSA